MGPSEVLIGSMPFRLTRNIDSSSNGCQIGLYCGSIASESRVFGSEESEELES